MWYKTKYLIRTENGKSEIYKYTKLKVDFDDNLPLAKKRHLLDLFLIIKMNTILKCFQKNIVMNIKDVLIL